MDGVFSQPLNTQHSSFTGDIQINPAGLARCRGKCTILSSFGSSPNFSTNRPSFSFQFIDFALKSVPTITFGMKNKDKHSFQQDTALFQFSYFDFLSTFRSSASPLISYDGIGVSIHMHYDNDNFLVYVNNELSKYEVKNIASTAYFFLDIDSDGICELLLPYHSESAVSTNCFFPNLIPRLWTCLPFLIQVRDFHIRGNTGLRSVYADEPLQDLPGHHGFKYFEVTIRSISNSSSNHSGIYIGLVQQPHAASECPPGRTLRSVGFSTISKTLHVSGLEFEISFGPIVSGSVIGLGLNDTNHLFMTHDGVISNHGILPDPGFPQYIPVISVVGSQDECYINLGQLPFKYTELQPPDGWCLYYKPPLYLENYEKGPPPENHILNFFPFTSIIGAPNFFETFVARKPLVNGERFEVTICVKSNDDNIVLGFSNDYVQGSLCGHDKKTIGVASEDGMLYRESSRGKMNIVDPSEIIQGKTIGLAYQDSSIYYTINKEKYSVVSDYNGPLNPTISAYGQIAMIVNFGDFPFVFTDSNKSVDGVKLFNGVNVAMTNNDLDKLGLSPGDYIEYRDLSLRGIFAGEYRNRYYVVVEGIDGALPLAENDPIMIRSSIRVLYCHSKIYKPMITFSDCIFAKLGMYERRSLYASRYGIAFMIGQTEKGGYVMRPIVDFMNNSHCFVLEEKPPNILKSNNPEIEPVFFNHGISFLDVIEDSDQTLMLMLGSQNGQIVGWNNVSITPLKGEPKILFRFNGIAFLSINNSLQVCVGIQKGGRYFPPNYHGTTGSQFFQHSTAQRSYGSRGMMPIPASVNLLLTTLNEQFTINNNETIARTQNRPTIKSSVIREIDDNYEAEVPKLPLLCEVTEDDDE
ncbi:hypothetical protein TRFO_31649 [Tritrichomonas foetus]|uniref:B30.2/SPRY domain-containing protein n=1 Tax=Tritrichomonas foetus TaxID=1144522 RepID=A0A1J4JVF1_9EUKA|nr:hypothetical protein TRFO_31649 [Tritrichomonas foetus]|eukprot:OHT01502.1 hypothetical protein TRFO_31649 [Tritrichomonas foetus]